MRAFGPGPGQYDVPNTFGTSPRRRCVMQPKDKTFDPKSTPGPMEYAASCSPCRRRQASWSFCSAPRGRRPNSSCGAMGKGTPGPGSYNPDGLGETSGTRFACASTWHGPVTPGPGDYSPKKWTGRSAKEATRSRFARQKRDAGGIPCCIPRGDSPGPAHYQGGPADDPSGIEKPSAPAHKFGGVPRFVASAVGGPGGVNPGPGTYDLKAANVASGGGFAEGPRVSFTPRRWRDSHLNPRQQTF
eukprot:TRINITY_DN22571_c0_g1_i1.p1 TRINITY_DN22571_c0_g1~~TRINITY_DN22571_c0_g1_i1.p1  ORF type:complete len:264 (-),score=15.54 TRINITY_DN22571_c0_g1_i1:432-1163(-)